jgi:hypothetical protein
MQHSYISGTVAITGSLNEAVQDNKEVQDKMEYIRCNTVERRR